MEAVKRVEVVTVAVARPRLLEAVERAGAPGYTILRAAEGYGDRGRRMADEVTAVFENLYVLIACTPEQAERIADAIRPILERFGGICLVSDATSTKH
jgi:PII-like signaling protein